MVGNKNSGNRNARYLGPFCGARTRRGTECKAPAMTNGRCRVHGGAALKGLDSPAFKHGRRSKYLPANVLAMVAELNTDEDRLAMETELALIDARMNQVLTAADGSAAPAAWKMAGDEMQKFLDASRRKNHAVAHGALQRLEEILTNGVGETKAWEEVRSIIDQRARLVEFEERRAVANGKAIPVDQVMNMIAAFQALVRDEVTDPSARRRISERLFSLVRTKRLPESQVPKLVAEATT